MSPGLRAVEPDLVVSLASIEAELAAGGSSPDYLGVLRARWMLNQQTLHMIRTLVEEAGHGLDL